MSEQERKVIGCEVIHKGIDGKFTMYNWVFGIVITLQLMTFSWVGYLSATVVALQIDYAGTKNIFIERLETLNKYQSSLEGKLDNINTKLDNLSKRGLGSNQ